MSRMRDEQLVEVVAAAASLQPFVVQREALDDVLAQAMRRPDAELRATVGLDAVADRDDQVEVEVLDMIRFSVSGSCCRFCNN